ncbi:MAG TPA: beta-ketoacyl synthase N-terminal-like domain-containing protein [Candidatus Wunengus sp. YC61]|uniref:beta-ketoacyl synthase N-terminal-like domain-containing protein n=1 Tax=Candidatus Wunengus sp. YC61 TaxID=3367698 RepID=UPI004026FC65
MRNTENEIAITGMCVLSAAGETASALCEQGISEKIIGKQIDLHLYEKEINSGDTGSRELYRIQKLLLAAFLKSAHMAGLKMKLTSPEMVSVFLGNSYGIEEFKYEFFRTYKKSSPALTSPKLFPFTNANCLASWLAIQAVAKGPSLTFVSGNTSSSEAVLAACDALTAKECEVAFVGSANIADNTLSEELDAAGFKHESVAMLVLENANNVRSSGRKCIAILKDRQSKTLTHEQMNKLKYMNSMSSVDDKMHAHTNNDSAEIIYLGNNLGDNVFSCGKIESQVKKEKKKSFFLNDVIGNSFDAAGVLGIGLSVDLLNSSKNIAWCPFDLPQKSILYSNVSSSGSAVTVLMSKT